MKIATIGLWHLGEVYSICLAKLGHRVIGIDSDEKTVGALKKGTPPLQEPNLARILKEVRKENNITFTSDFSEVSKCDAVWFTIDTPIDKKDNAKLDEIFEKLEAILPSVRENTTIIVSSQIGLGGSGRIVDFIRKNRPGLKFEYAYVPENLRIGESVKGFFEPTKIVIGTEFKNTYLKVRRIFKNLPTEFLYMSTSSAEMIKEATNSYLATSLAFIFDIADLCEETGADITDVVRALRLDPRIGKNAYLGVSVGFSGGTLGRALKYIMKEAKSSSVKTPVVNAVWKKNLERKTIVSNKLLPILKSFKNKKVGFYGLTYKGGVTTLRNSRAVEIIEDVYKKGAAISIYDKNIRKEELEKALEKVEFNYYDSPYLASEGVHCLVFITPSKNLKRLSFDKLRSKMIEPAVFFDTQNFFYDNKKEISKAGFSYMGLGL